MILAFAGGIGSGKTSLSNALALQLAWSKASFGDHLRSIAQQRGEPETREHLQALGDAFISQGWTEFCNSVLTGAGWKPGSNMIVDGVRHIEAFDTLTAICAPSSVYLIFVSAASGVRLARLTKRDTVNAHDFERFEQHSSENQRGLLHDRADLIIDGALSLQESTVNAVSFVNKLGNL